MRPFAPLFLLATCASVTATGLISLQLTKLKRTAGPEHEARAVTSQQHRTTGQSTSVPITNVAAGYTTSVGIGNPPTYYNLVIDSGSSDTWCGLHRPYNRTSTSISTGQNLSIVYVTGNIAGVEYLDQVTLGPNLVITNQSIGDATSSYYLSLFDFDGIIGLGPRDLTNGTLSPDTNSTIPTILDNLVSQGLIEKPVFSLYFSPSENDSDTNGVMTYGGYDQSLFEGELMYVPLTETFPASLYWGINATSATNGNLTFFPNSTAGIVDSGTSGFALADDFFSAYMKAIPGAVWNWTSLLLEIPPASISSMQPVTFVIGDMNFTLDVAAQLVLPSQNTAWGGVPGKQYGVASPLGSSSGIGLDFVIGMLVMERYYTVFDADAKRVGFARAKNNSTL